MNTVCPSSPDSEQGGQCVYRFGIESESRQSGGYGDLSHASGEYGTRGDMCR